MPTGYTYPIIKEGITFEQFVLRCARNFGALLDMRDAPSDAPIPDEVLPSDYYIKQLEKSRQDLAKYLDMTLEEAASELKAVNEKTAQAKAEYRAKLDRDNQLLRDMLEKVEVWEPPTVEHNGLKNFMLEQINISIEDYMDTGNGSDDAAFYLLEMQKNAARMIQRSLEEHGKEVDRCQRKTDWIRALKQSLTGV